MENQSILPTINACFNGVAAVFLFSGWRAIKKGDREAHRKFMVGALVASGAFLSCYLYYHFTVQLVTAYQGTGIWRAIYYIILATHVPLATLMVPFVLYAVWMAVTQDFAKHKRVTKWLWPVWMYVSVTGVIVYLMLYVF